MRAAVALCVASGVAVGAAILGVAACGALTEPPTSPAPVNTCLGAGGCTPFPEAGCNFVGASSTVVACTTAVAPSFVLVVTVPALAPHGAGMTYVFSGNQFLGPTPNKFPCAFTSANTSCILLPSPVGNAQTTGAYLVDYALQEAADRNLGLVPAMQMPPNIEYVGLPMTAMFWPQWTEDSVTLDARQYNLPLPPVVASIGPSPDYPLIGETTHAPGGGLTTGWYAALPPTAAPYLGVVQVDPPFNDGYPDQSYSVQAISGPPSGELAPQLGLLPAGALGITSANVASVLTTFRIPVSRPAGLDGWTMFVRERANGIVPPAIVSSRPRLSGVTTAATLNLLGFSPTPGTTYNLVLEPPFASGLPEFDDPLLSVGGALIPPASETYPTLPPPVTLSGRVVSPENTPVSATILFYSTEVGTLNATSKCVLIPSTSTGIVTELSYEAQVQTDDQLSATGEVGGFSIQLPQGQYNYVIQPSLASGYAKTTVSAGLYVGDCPGPFTNPVTLTASHPVVVSGSFVTADGRPLANATVDFLPSALLVVPTLPTGGTITPPSQWPRPATTTTGAAGGFSLEVDPGTYDITARPQDGTNFAWAVAPGFFIPPPNGNLTTAIPPLAPFVVPAPAVLDVVIEDPDGINLPGAIVQAYAFTSCSAPSSSYCQPVAVPIGEAMTDAQGEFVMLLSGFVNGP